MTDTAVVKELNAFLKGNYMAIHAYERYIQYADIPEVKKELQEIQQNHKRHAMRVAERIQNLGGVPVDDPGMMEIMADMKNMLKGTPKDTSYILKDALLGENKGIQMSEELVRGDLDAESLAMVKDILDRDRGHLEQLNRYLH